jgi:hypothetical protein
VAEPPRAPNTSIVLNPTFADAVVAEPNPEYDLSSFPTDGDESHYEGEEPAYAYEDAQALAMPPRPMSTSRFTFLDLAQQPGFHGTISTTEAEETLSSQLGPDNVAGRSCYLVRVSAGDGSSPVISMAIRTAAGSIEHHHTKIVVKNGEMFDAQGNFYEDFASLVSEWSSGGFLSDSANPLGEPCCPEGDCESPPNTPPKSFPR